MFFEFKDWERPFPAPADATDLWLTSEDKEI